MPSISVHFYWAEIVALIRNKIPLVLPFEGFPLMTKQVTNYFFIAGFTPEVSRGDLLQ